MADLSYMTEPSDHGLNLWKILYEFSTEGLSLNGLIELLTKFFLVWSLAMLVYFTQITQLRFNYTSHIVNVLNIFMMKINIKDYSFWHTFCIFPNLHSFSTGENWNWNGRKKFNWDWSTLWINDTVCGRIVWIEKAKLFACF